MGGGCVDGGHLGAGEAPEQCESAGSCPAAQVHDVQRGGFDGQPRGDGRGVLGEHFRVEVEDLRLVVIGVGVGVLVRCGCHDQHAKWISGARRHRFPNAQEGGSPRC